MYCVAWYIGVLCITDQLGNHYMYISFFISLWLKENNGHFVLHVFDPKVLQYTLLTERLLLSFMVFSDLQGHCELLITVCLFSGLS